MIRPALLPALAAAALAVGASSVPALAAPPPSGASDPVLATVNGDPVRLSRLRGEAGSLPAPGDAPKALDRMVGVELVIQEGYRMGLEQTIEVRDQMGIFERDTLRDGLFAARVHDLQPDPAAVDALAKGMTVEVRLRSAAFASEADARALVARAAKGDDFDAAAKELTANRKGSVDPGEGFIHLSELRPEVQAAIAPLAPGGVSAVYRIGGRFAVSRLLERRAAPDPDAHAKAEAEVRRRAQTEAIAKYVDELRQRDAKVDQRLYATLDFESAKPGFESYLHDRRPLVTIAGAEPITVQDLADAVRKRLFHGAENAAEAKALNHKRDEVLDDLIAKRVVVKEARAQGLDRRPAYLALRRETERQLVFGAFVAKVIQPDVKVTDAEVGKYYDAHRREFTAPDMARLDAIAFSSRSDAEAALAKLHAGEEFEWTRANAPGRLDPATHPQGMVFPSTPVILSDLPEGLRRALTGAASGDDRLYAAPGGTTYLIRVRELLPGRVQPLEDVAGGIRAKLGGEQRQRAFDDYVARLRQASDVKLLVTPEQLAKLVAAAPAS
jgi:peptidyl-prolyl cis-trans isomerase C